MFVLCCFSLATGVGGSIKKCKQESQPAWSSEGPYFIGFLSITAAGTLNPSLAVRRYSLGAGEAGWGEESQVGSSFLALIPLSLGSGCWGGRPRIQSKAEDRQSALCNRPHSVPAGTERRRLMHFTAWGQPRPTREDRAGKNPSLRIGESPLATLFILGDSRSNQISGWALPTAGFIDYCSTVTHPY